MMYSHVAFKAAHNSVDRDEIPVTEQLRNPTSRSPHQAGCRGLELDIHDAPNLWEWSVSHTGPYNPDVNQQLFAYLRLLVSWSDGHRGHDPVFVTIDVKPMVKSPTRFAREFDRLLDRELGAKRLFTPAELQRDAATLVEGANRYGWPTVDELRGRFIVCLSGEEVVKKHYSRARNRRAFADIRVGHGARRPGAQAGDRVVVNYRADQTNWERDARHFAATDGFLTRLYGIDDPVTWQRALGAGVNILSTDRVRKYEWATVTGTSERFFPHGP
jgi:hypothetical protein